MRYLFLFVFSVFIGALIIISYTFVISQYNFHSTKTSPSIQPTKTPTTIKTIPFNAAQAPTEALQGQITTLSGQTDWQSRTATQPAILTAPVAIQQGEAVDTLDNGKMEIQFSTCCTINMLANSSLAFVQTLPVNLVINQTLGNVTYQKTGNVPLTVRTFHLLTKIEQGNVNIAIDPNRPVVAITVNSGSVQVAYNDLQYNSSVTQISAGNVFYFNDETRNTDTEPL
ncbi:MAG TPA: hypothetical protein VMR41_01560 [Patescibacteria group bacterium]|nr:hypothetical protein [Patescibacteria group bacterium]